LNANPRFNKPKPIVEKIILTKEQEQDIRTILEGHPSMETIERRRKWSNNTENWLKYRIPSTSSFRIDRVRRKYFKGLCHICQALPVYKVLYKLPDVTLIEFYCESHKQQIAHQF
jgi:hypothetical protein